MLPYLQNLTNTTTQKKRKNKSLDNPYMNMSQWSSVADLRDFKRDRMRSFYLKSGMFKKNDNKKTNKSTSKLIPMQQQVSQIIKHCNELKALDYGVPLTYEQIIEKLDADHKSSFLKVEPTLKRRFYDTIKTVEYLDNEKRLEVENEYQMREKDEGVDYLPIQMKKISDAKKKMRKKQFVNDVALGLKYCLQVFRSRRI